MTTLFNHNVPHDYFSLKNLKIIKNNVEKMLKSSFDKTYTVDDPSILRIMHRVLEERLECIDRMLERSTMYIVSEIKQFEIERNKHLKWENEYRFSQSPYNISARLGPPLHGIKLSKQPTTLRFYYTYGYNARI